VSWSQKQYQIVRDLFVQPDGTLTDATHRESTQASINLIREMLLERVRDKDLVEVIDRTLSFEPTAGYLVDDAARIVEKRVHRAVESARRKNEDSDGSILNEIFPVICAIAIDIGGADPNALNLPESGPAGEIRATMRSYLAAKRRWEDISDVSSRPSQVQEDIFQIKSGKREIASQRRALAQLLDDADAAVKARLLEIDRRLQDIEQSFKINRDLLKDDLTHLRNATSADENAREKRFQEFLQGTETLLSKTTADVIASYKTEIETLNADREHVDDRLRATMDGLKDYIARADAAETRLNVLNASLNLTEENLAAFKKAAEERAGQSQSRQHWSRRVMINSVGFGISLGLILFFLIVVPILGFLYSPDILQFLKSVSGEINSELGASPNAAQVTMAAVNRLLLIGAPVALYFWLVRILVRYNSMALAMMDDAHQRRTMIDTYIHLIEHQVARTEDRAILLNAIFRASPGQGNDVEPPSFVDLIDRLKPST
jgi:hypothetical protein